MTQTAHQQDIQTQIQNGEVPSGYVLAPWPQSQGYMGPGGPIADGEAILVNSGPLFREHGKACYLIPEKRA
ncbi:hypothetical protein GGP91_002798 [Salinibacter ruber]|uniref:hypothetical protein n=1 Tax=Salinibacter ruber TaxID=146919 RepID=UPI0021681B0A|nr:hypothetical protein [Salinibacter ruber]MCS3830705.1 hypothetical protein [Salinibacter ruber]MCS4057180.1 hypothetical protein [Salinibacter ruber]